MKLDFRDIQFAGREVELQILKDCVSQTINAVGTENEEKPSKRSRLCLIEGSAGMGKTTLLEKLQQSVANDSVNNSSFLVCKGKFVEEDDDDVSSPLSTFGECLVGLIQQLIAIQDNHQTDPGKEDWRIVLADELRYIKDKNLASVHADLHDLLAVRPDGSPRLKSSKSFDESASSCSARSSEFMFDDSHVDQYVRNRERVALRGAFRRIATSIPVIMILEDIHWISTPALHVLKSLVVDTRSSGMLIICTQRELDETHILKTELLEAAKNANSEWLEHIRLGGLNSPTIGSIVARLLHRDETDVKPLAECVYRKTKGNSFYVIQFLRHLADQNFIYYSTSQFRWEWDLDRIVNETELSDNVVDLVASKIERLDPKVQRVLTAAALFGTSYVRERIFVRVFQFEINEEGTEQKDNDSAACIKDILSFAVKEGLLDQMDGSKYRFSHCKIRESAKALLPEGEELVEFQRFLGTRLLEFGDEIKEDDLQLSNGILLVATNILNQCTTTPDCKLLELNLQASEIAISRAGYQRAVCYLLNANRFQLRQEKWAEGTYDISLRMSNNLAHCLYYTGDLDGSLKISEEVFEYSRSLEDRISMTKLQAEILIHQSKYEKSIQFLLAALDDVDCHLPRRNLWFRFMMDLRGLNKQLYEMTDQEILDLPDNTDPMIALKLRLLWLLAIAAASADKEAYKGIAFVGFTRCVLRNGAEPGTLPLAMSTLSLWYNKFGRIEMFHRLRILSWTLLEREGVENVHGATATAFLHQMLHHHSHPYQDSISPLLRSIRILEKFGTLDQVATALCGYALIYFHSGLQLQALLPDMVKSAELLHDCGQLHYLSMFQPLAQLVSNLCGCSENPNILTGDFMDYDACISEWTGNENKRALSLCRLYRMYLCYFTGEIEEAFKESLQLITRIKPTLYCAPKFFMQGIVECCMGETSKKRRSKAKHIKAAKGFLRKIQIIVKRKNPNCVHSEALLRAQLDATEFLQHQHFKGRYDDIAAIQQAFDKGIALAARGGFLHDQAIGNQRAGEFFLSLDKEDGPHNDRRYENNRFWAGTYLVRSIELLYRWGAIEAAKALERRHETFLKNCKEYTKSTVACNDQKDRMGIKARSRLLDLGEVKQFVGEPV